MTKTPPREQLPDACALADKLNGLCVAEYFWPYLNNAATLLRKQHAELEALRAQAARVEPVIQYTPGQWFEAKTREGLKAFFLSRLPAIRDAAKAHGYAIGLHGTLTRDMDLIAVPWRDGAADIETLAHAVANAACGITRDGAYEWESKPAGRMATSIPCCWPSWHGEAGAGHIDLSVVPPTPAHIPADVEARVRKVEDGGHEFNTGDRGLDLLLGLTTDIADDNANMDTGVWWLQTLEEIKARLSAHPPQAPQAVGDAETAALIKECRDAFAEELSAYDIDPPIHHVKQGHDKCVAWLASHALATKGQQS